MDFEKYSKIIMGKYKSVYIAVNKVATISIKNALSKYEGGEEQEDFFRFSFVRNPFDRVLSCYCDKVKNKDRNDIAPCLIRFGVFYKNMSLSEFIDSIIKIPDEECDVHFKPQYLFFPDRMDFIGKLENINLDFIYVLKKCNIPIVKLDYFNKSNKSNKSNILYSNEDINKILKKYKKDFDIFGYKENYEGNLLC